VAYCCCIVSTIFSDSESKNEANSWRQREFRGKLSVHCTMLLEQIKGFYHGITKIFLLVGSYTMLSWLFLKMLI